MAYTKNGLANGAVISKAALDNMENGIAAALASADADGAVTALVNNNSSNLRAALISLIQSTTGASAGGGTGGGSSTVTLVSPAYFVSTTGNDNNAGTAAAPFLTFEKAQTAMRNSSTKTTYLRGGTWNRTTKFSMSSADSGTSWLGYPGETAIVDGASTLIDAFFIDAGSSNIKIDRINFQNVKTCAIHLSGYINSPVTGCVISNGVFKNVVSDGQYGAGNGGAIRGTFCTKNNIVQNNTFQDMFCPGTSFVAGGNNEYTQGNIVRRNKFLRCNRGQADTGSIYFLDRGHAHDVNNPCIIDYNYVEDASDQTEGKAIYLDDEASYYTITNNILVGRAHWHFQIHGGDHINISNNIIDMSEPKWPADYYMFLYQDDVGAGFPNYGMAGNTFTKNILYTSAVYQKNQMWQFQDGTNGQIAKPSVSNNLYYGAQGQLPAGSGDIVDTSPKYANPNFTSPTTRDYSFVNNSGYSQIGFTPINQALIGPQS